MNIIKKIQKKVCYIFNENISARVISALPLQLSDKVVFSNFLGKGYGENPKYIAEEFLRRKLPYELVWLVNDLNAPMPNEIRKVKYGSIAALYELATAKVWVDNVRNTMRPRKKPRQVYLQMWHGLYGDKPVERQAEGFLSKKYVRQAKTDGQICDGFCCGNAFQKQIFLTDFWLNSNVEMLEYGAPAVETMIRNCKDKEYQQETKTKMGYAEDYLILYAPTFRDDQSTEAYNLDYQGVLDAFKPLTGKPCKLVIRFHPNVIGVREQIAFSDEIVDGSTFADYSVLPLICDAAISDYSSVLYDFALSQKPAFIYAPDEGAYFAKRGHKDYYLNDPFQKAHSNRELLEQIGSFRYETYMQRVNAYFEKYPLCDTTDSAKKYVDWILLECSLK